MINKKIPYYEQGRICEIKEENKKLVIKRYSYNKNKINTFYAAKNNKNMKELLNNYYIDLERYLNLNKEKYITYKKEKIDNIEDLKNMKKYKKIIFFLSLIPIIASTINPSISNLLYLELIFIPTFLVMEYTDIKYEKETTKQKFVKEYINYRKELDTYKNTKQKILSPTSYTKIKMNHNISKEIDLNLKKEKKIA